MTGSFNLASYLFVYTSFLMNSFNYSLQHKPQSAWEFPRSICCPQLAPGAPASSVNHHGASQLHRQCLGSTAAFEHLPLKYTFVHAPPSGDVELHGNFPVAEHLQATPSLQHMNQGTGGS